MSKKPGRLAMVLKGFPRISETFISNEILAMERRGINISIFSLRKPRESFSHRSIRNIQAPVTYLPEYVLPHWKILLSKNLTVFSDRPHRYLSTLFGAVRRSLATSAPLSATLRHFLQGGYMARHLSLSGDVVHLHAHFAHTPTSVALFASQLTGIPFSFTAHAKDIYTSHPTKLRYKISRALFVVTCTQYNRSYLADIARGLPTPIYTVYHGIDLSRFPFSPQPYESPPFKILSVGRLVAKKGYDDLLRALHILKCWDFPFEFLHVGDGELKESVYRMASELDLIDKVRFLGTLTQEELCPLYHRSHLFVLASKIAPNGDRDGLPNVILEAMATGLPVVSTRVSAIPEAVQHERTGILVTPGKPHELAQMIRWVLSSPQKTASMIVEARRFVEKQFDAELWASKLYEIFARALECGVRKTDAPCE